MQNAHPVEILLVEDSPDDIELTLRVLREHNLGSHVQVVRDGEQALDFMFGRGAFAGRRVEERPRVILLDLNMPKMGGLEVLKALRADPRTRIVPVVILTSSREESDLLRSYELGTNSFITKPVDFDQFTEAMRLLGCYWVLHNILPGGEGRQA